MMKKAYYKIIIFTLAAAIVQIYSMAGAPFIYAAGNAVPSVSQPAPASGKIPVCEAIMKYYRLWDGTETNDITMYQLETAAPEEKTLKMLEDKLGDRSPAYEVMLSIADGLPAMFKAMTPAEREFVIKNFSNTFLRATTKLIAGGAKFLSSKGKCIPASRALFSMCLLVTDFESAVTSGSASQGPLLTKMIAVACRKICFETLVRVILNGGFDEKYCSNFYRTFEFIDRSQFPISKTMELEKTGIIRIIRAYTSLDIEKVKEFKDAIYPPEVFAKVSAEIKKSPFAVKVAGMYGDEAISQIGGIFLKYDEAFKKPFKEASAIFGEIDKNFSDGKYNNFFTQVAIPNMGRAYWQSVRIDVISDMAKTAALLKLHRSLKKKFPEKLGELASTASAMKVPKDRFSGEDFLYLWLSDDSFLLISAGPNMRLDGKYDKKFDKSQSNLTSSDDIIMTEEYISVK